MSLADAVEINADGWLWPKGDRYTWPTVKHELAEIPALLALCDKKRVCIQAGGNGGLWVDLLAQEFEAVYSFEPCPINFRCLVHNVPRENTIFTQSALGEETGLIAIDRSFGGLANPGANRVDPNPNAKRIIPVRAIDDMKLQNVDLIQLDVEGFELFALRGAKRTIARCQPVICVELRGNAQAYGSTDDEVRRFLTEQGYKAAFRMNHDEFWLPQ